MRWLGSPLGFTHKVCVVANIAWMFECITYVFCCSVVRAAHRRAYIRGGLGGGHQRRLTSCVLLISHGDMEFSPQRTLRHGCSTTTTTTMFLYCVSYAKYTRRVLLHIYLHTLYTVSGATSFGIDSMHYIIARKSLRLVSRRTFCLRRITLLWSY